MQQANRVRSRHGMHGFELAIFERGNAGARFSSWYRSSGCGHDHGFRWRGQMQLNRDGMRMSADLLAARSEARSQDLNLVTAGRQLAEGGDSLGGSGGNLQSGVVSF